MPDFLKSKKTKRFERSVRLMDTSVSIATNLFSIALALKERQLEFERQELENELLGKQIKQIDNQ